MNRLAVLMAALCCAVGARAGEAAPVPLDWARLFAGPERVVYVGEEHSNAAIKAELAAHLDEAVAAGITALAVEVPQSPGVRELVEAARARGLAVAMISPVPHPPGGSIGEIYAKRDRMMAENVARLLGPEGRVLALMGHLHVRAGSQPALLRALGHESKALVFLTRSGLSMGLGRVPGVTGSLDTARRTGQRLYLPLDRAATGYDGVLIVPAACP